LVDLYFSRVTFEREENLWNIGFEQDHTNSIDNAHYSIEDVRESSKIKSNDELVAIRLLRDPRVKVFERTKSDILSALGLIGGFSSAIFYVFRFLTSFVTTKLYHAALIKKLYHLKRIPAIGMMRLRGRA
jgi:hypothetical protein